MRLFLIYYSASFSEFATKSFHGEMNSSAWYMIAGIIALIILGYLLIALIKPEKF
jgi:K+-transporting ATPase KdpF subunit